MKIDEIKYQIEIDKKIDHTQLDTESLKIPEQAVKYQQMAHDAALRLRFLEKEYNVAKYNRWMYYMGKADPDVYDKEPFDHKVLKSDVNIFLESDSVLNEIQDRIIAQTEKLKLIVKPHAQGQNSNM